MRASPSPLALFVAAVALLAVACGDGAGKKRPLGATCERGDDCASGLCADNKCIDPAADEDNDGLSNGLEVALGTNPFNADTDGDGTRDADELTADFQPKDSDGDGIQDALESATTDTDLDCIADQFDIHNNRSDGADSDRLPELCPAAIGACGAAGARLRVMCPDGLDAPVCDFAEVPGYEAVETACDGVDNDCDGATDLGCDPLTIGLVGHWKLDNDGLDSGPFGDHGTVNGATGTADRFGVANSALSFTVPGQRVSVPSTHHPKGDTDASYAVWVRPEHGADAELGVFTFGQALEKNHRSSLVLNGDRHCANYVAEGNDAASQRACAPAGHWTHIAIVKAGHDITFWVDGRQHETVTLEPGQDLRTTGLVIGMSKDDSADFFEPFFGAIDDLWAWDRAITKTEIDLLFNEGARGALGTAARPAQSCLHIRDAAAGTPATGSYTLDLDGDGPQAPFAVYCDMDLDGGGWTLAWVYGFTDFADFGNVDNAVTPIPSWPEESATVPVSTTPPSSPETPGAIDWALWKDVGRAFMVVSDLNDGIACEPGGGSLSDGLDGWLDCETVVDVTQTCQGVVPKGVFFSRLGPVLYAQDLYYYFDGSVADGWPAHDPCGANSAQHVASPARAGGAIYLRATDHPIQWPSQCDYVSGLQRTSGTRRIDPDGLGGSPSFEAECDFDVERGGWTRVSDAMRASMAARPEVAREFLYTRGDRFYRTPSVVSPWPDGFAAAPGRWVYQAATGADAFECVDSGVGAGGVGCASADAAIATNGPLALGVVDLCQSPPDAFGSGEACSEAAVWVREGACRPDAGSLLGDGELSAVAASVGSWGSPCWYALGPNGWLDAFASDSDVPRGGLAPSLKVSNPTLGNAIYDVELGQQGLVLIAGKTYTLSFWAKASAPRTLRAFVQSVALARVSYEDIAITTTWARYEMVFTPNETIWNAMVSLQLGEVSTAALWLDQLGLTED